MAGGMEPFSRLEGRAAPLLLANIDTDQITPARFMKTATRRGLGRYLFYFMRYDEAGALTGTFVLDRPENHGAKILIAGDNFGCGSSREHAPWALKDFGIRCIIAPSFADIFAGNCLLNGILLVVLPQKVVEDLAGQAAEGRMIAVDLSAQTVRVSSGPEYRFDIDPVKKAKLLNGLDPIAETLNQDDAIAHYENARPRFLTPVSTGDRAALCSHGAVPDRA